MANPNKKRYTVTTALPYANGPVHIGHLAGVYIPADIFVRYLRANGKEVFFLGGSDEHGVPITIKAQKENTTPQDIVDRYHNIIKNSFEEFMKGTFCNGGQNIYCSKKGVLQRIFNYDVTKKSVILIEFFLWKILIKNYESFLFAQNISS